MLYTYDNYSHYCDCLQRHGCLQCSSRCTIQSLTSNQDASTDCHGERLLLHTASKAKCSTRYCYYYSKCPDLLHLCTHTSLLMLLHCCATLYYQAVPVILNLGVRNLVLVGDHMQLQQYTDVHITTAASATHTRSLMQRVVQVRYYQCITCTIAVSSHTIT
jgi:hypothetical protein